MDGEGAKKLASRWVQEVRKDFPRLEGAYLSGSVLEAEPGVPWPESSDVDVVLVFPQGECPEKIGKFFYHGLLLEAACLEDAALDSLEEVLATHYLAWAFQAGEILWDREGKLQALHRQVAPRYACREWVEIRWRRQLDRIRQDLESWPPEGSFSQRVNAWLFPTGITCFPVLIADLKNCTVRRRYAAARETLSAYGMRGFYPKLLKLLVPEPLGRNRLEGHWKALAETFSLACGTTGPSCGEPYRGDVSPQGARSALEGTRVLLESPWPEEAVFWMAASFLRCQRMLELDAPSLAARRLPALLHFLQDLGAREESDLKERGQQVLRFLPVLEEAAEEIRERREKGLGVQTLSKDF